VVTLGDLEGEEDAGPEGGPMAMAGRRRSPLPVQTS
jgi:hypothetical protein